MKKTIQKIDRAIKSLYEIEFYHFAEDYLILQKPENARSAANNQQHSGALYIYSENPDQLDFELGVFLSEPIQKVLKTFPNWKKGHWKSHQLSAFAIACEEVSHFNYFLSKTADGKKLTALELETQGEIDKFLITFFANYSPQKNNGQLFQSLFEKLFVRFRLSDHLTAVEKQLYLQANHLAQKWILQIKNYLVSGNLTELGLKIVRKKYHS